MTKERLRGYRALTREKETLEHQIETVEAALYSPRIQRLKHTPSAPSPENAMEDLAAKHMELLDLYKAKLAELASEMLAIEQAIDSLPPTERTLLRLYYLDGMTWEEVCVGVGYSWMQTHRIHGRALEMLKDDEG